MEITKDERKQCDCTCEYCLKGGCYCYGYESNTERHYKEYVEVDGERYYGNR